MSFFDKVQDNILSLQSDKEKFDNLISNFNASVEESYKLDILKEEMLSLLSKIFSNHCEDVLSVSFKMRVNEVRKTLVDTLNEKKDTLVERVNEREILVQSLKELLGFAYLVDTIKKNVHIGMNIEKRLFDIKNDSKDIVDIEKRIYATNFINEKLELYKDGLKQLVKILKGHKRKTEISFDDKNKIYEIFNSISVENQFDDNHSKMFNENIYEYDDSTLVVDYILYFEKIFVENANTIGINISGFTENIVDIFSKKDSKNTLINNLIEYIYGRYKLEIENFKQTSTKKKNKCLRQLKKQLESCYEFDGLCVIDDIYENLAFNNNLSNYIGNSEYNKTLKNLFFSISKDELELENIKVVDFVLDINKSLIDSFDYEKYNQIYEFNYKNKNKLISYYRQYYFDLLEDAKEKVINTYLEKLEKYFKKNKIDKIDISKLDEQIIITDSQITKLEKILDYVDKNYENFTDENFKDYLQAIEQRYTVKNLYDSVLNTKSNFLYKLKTKKKIVEENIKISQFIDDEKINNRLRNVIVSQLFLDKDKDLKDEILKKIMCN